MNKSNILIRKATADDIDILIKLRIDFHLDRGKQWSRENIEDIEKRLRKYFEQHIQTDGFVAVLAELSGEAVSGAFISIVERPPRKPNASNLVGTVHNVYTYP